MSLESIAPLTPAPRRPSWDPPATDTIRLWVDQLGIEGSRAYLTVKAALPEHRASVYQMTRRSDLHRVALDEGDLVYDWPKGRLVDNICSRMNWQQVVQTLVDSRTLHTEDELKAFIDSNVYPTLGAVVHAIWEAKFLQEDGDLHKMQVLIRALSKWAMNKDTLLADEIQQLDHLGLPLMMSDPERYDVVMLLLTLGAQNHLFDRVIFPIDGLDRVLKTISVYQWYDQFDTLIRSVEKWSTFGCPVGITFGVKQDPLGLFGDNDLGRRLQENLV